MAEVITSGKTVSGSTEVEGFVQENGVAPESYALAANRKEKRKASKKTKRKQIRRHLAVKEREKEEARLNDPEEQMRMRLKEQEEAENAERERRLFEEREAMWLEKATKVKEEAERKLLEESHKEEVECDDAMNEHDSWEYIEEGPAQIIWQGNEIIMKKKKIRVLKTSLHDNQNHEAGGPTSNPLAPQSAAFDGYIKATSISTEALFESVATQIPNFGTEQDKAHCPFHIKTGACRFGTRCSRVHYYPDKSFTLLLKNMYNGPGLAWEQDEGLEYTEEEVDRYLEEFYEDVHTEFLKFGEIVNFKITCTFVGVTRWKVAICGEYMKSRHKTCSRGSACNFLHCFRNPGGDYEWADRDSRPPRYWVEKMVSLFGPSARDEEERVKNEQLNSRNKMASDFRHRSAKRWSPDTHDVNDDSSREKSDEDGRRHRHKHSRMRNPYLNQTGSRKRDEANYLDGCEQSHVLALNDYSDIRCPDGGSLSGNRYSKKQVGRNHGQRCSYEVEAHHTDSWHSHEAEYLDRDTDKEYSDDHGAHIGGTSRGRVHHHHQRGDSLQYDDFDHSQIELWTGDAGSDEDGGSNHGDHSSKGKRYHLDRRGSSGRSGTYNDDHDKHCERLISSKASGGGISLGRKSFESYNSDRDNDNYNEDVAFNDDSAQQHDLQDVRDSDKGYKSTDDLESNYLTQHGHHRRKHHYCSREKKRHRTKPKQKKMDGVDQDSDELKSKKNSKEDRITYGGSRLDAVDKEWHASKSSKHRHRKHQNDESDLSDDLDRPRRERAMSIMS